MLVLLPLGTRNRLTALASTSNRGKTNEIHVCVYSQREIVLNSLEAGRTKDECGHGIRHIFFVITGFYIYPLVLLIYIFSHISHS